LRRAEISTVFSPSDVASGFAQILDEPQPIRGTLARELDRVHRLVNEVQSEAAGPQFLERPAAQFVGIDCGATVAEKNLEPLFDRLAAPSRSPPKVEGDGPVWPVAVGMAQDVGERFIDGARDGPALRGGESERFGQRFHCSAHGRKQSGIAAQRDHQ